MDIIEMLKDEHKQVKALFEKLEATTTAATKTRLEGIAKLEHDLLVHMEFEERIFYPEIKANTEKDGKELTCEAYAEHEAAVGCMEKLNALGPDDEMWKAWLMVMKEGVTHHIKEEEGELFGYARKAIPAERRAEMAAEYKAMKAERKAPNLPEPKPAQRTPASVGA